MEIDVPDKRAFPNIPLLDAENFTLFQQSDANLGKRALSRNYQVCNNVYDINNIIPYSHVHSEGSGENPSNQDICPPDGSNPFQVADCLPGINKYLDYHRIEDSESVAYPAGISPPLYDWRMVQNPGRGTNEAVEWKHYASRLTRISDSVLNWY